MLNVNVIKAKSTQKVEVKPGQPTHLKVDANTRLELVDSASGKAPTQIKARRVGDNLEIVTDEKAQIEDTTVSNAQAPDLVLEDYFKQADVSLYAGTGQEAVSYVPVDGAASSSYAAMFTSATTGAALAAAPLLSPWMGVAAGAGVAAAAGGGGGGGGAPVANQAPVAKDDTKSVTENGRLEGAVPNATDADGTVASYRLVGDVASGKLTFNADGSYSFDANKDFDNLAIGQTKTVNFTYSAVDNAGGVSAPKTVTITVTGTNDAPVASAATKSVDEGMKVEGSVTATDADAGATLTYALVGAAPAGLSFKNDGTYSFDASDVAYNSLKAGETQDVLVKFKANDGTVDSAEQTLTIKVKGVNDAATISGTATGDVTEDATTTVKGSLSVSDVDTGQAKVEAQTDTAGKFGKFSITEAGEWTYELDNELIQSLPKESFLEDELTVKSIDGSATKDVVITINGADDRAEIKFVKDATGEDLKIVKSPELVNPEAPSAKGTLSVGMLDFNDEIIVSGIKFNSEESSPLTGSNLTKEALEDGFLNSLVLHPITNNGGLHNLAWDFYTGGTLPADFRLVLDYTLQSVNKGEDEPVSTVVIQVDVTGVNSPVTVSLQQNDKDQVNVTETNDEVESGIQTLTVNEWDYGNKVNVKVGSAKVNLEKSTFLEASNVDASFEEYIQQWLHIGDFRDLSGVSNLDWNFKTTLEDLDPVPEGEKMVLDYVLNFYENDSPEPVTTKTIEVTIEGKNDAPIYKSLIDGGGEDSSFAKLNVSTNSKANAKGTLSPYDPDFIETITHEIKDLEFDAEKSTQGMKEKFDALSVSLKDLLTLEVLPEFSEPHSLTWKFNAAQADLSLVSAGVQAESVLAMNYVLRVTDFYGAFSEQRIHIELNV
jgi:VCBS repeat-containing protein